MKLDSLFLGIFVTAFGGQLHAQNLTCYKCVYIEGDSSTSKTCENNPTRQETHTYVGHPPLRKMAEETPQVFNHHKNITHIANEVTKTDSTYAYPFCSTLKGTLYGKKFVRRGALGGNETHSDYFCRNGKPVTTAEPLLNPKTCTCNTDLCNVGNWDEGGRDYKPPATTEAGAGALTLGLAVLFTCMLVLIA